MGREQRVNQDDLHFELLKHLTNSHQDSLAERFKIGTYHLSLEKSKAEREHGSKKLEIEWSSRLEDFQCGA